HNTFRISQLLRHLNLSNEHLLSNRQRPSITPVLEKQFFYDLNHYNMRTSTAALLLSTIAFSSAFDLNFFQLKGCIGDNKLLSNFTLETGCHSFNEFGPGNESLAVQWSNELDNDYLVMAFADVNCCNGAWNSPSSWGWRDECMHFDGFKSIRVVDPNDINRGGKLWGEPANYECTGEISEEPKKTIPDPKFDFRPGGKN
ncbi:hypothetical protein B0J11DRAFT_594105, partial [Dendryphion nanum]